MVTGPQLIPTMQSLWVGERLSNLEQLSICSYLAHGHPYHLYTYGPLAGVPEGVVLKDANEILPRSRIHDFSFIQNFSDQFRYSLLWEKGGYWTDTDAVCLKPVLFTADHVFSSEARNRETSDWQVNSGTIRVPPRSPYMRYALDKYEGVNVRKVGWIYFGPQLMAEIVDHFALKRYVKSPATFCPVPWWDTNWLVQRSYEFGSETVACHLWNEMWNKYKMDKDATYPGDTLYEQFKRVYLYEGQHHHPRLQAGGISEAVD